MSEMVYVAEKLQDFSLISLFLVEPFDETVQKILIKDHDLMACSFLQFSAKF